VNCENTNDFNQSPESDSNGRPAHYEGLGASNNSAQLAENVVTPVTKCWVFDPQHLPESPLHKLALPIAALALAAASEGAPPRPRPDTRGVVGASGRANPAKKAERKRQRKARRQSR
jgi:hypothetical protein